MTDRELMQQALEALNRSDYLGWQLNIPIIKALRERLAQPVQEPVAWTATRLWYRKKTWKCPADIEKDLLYAALVQQAEQEPVAWRWPTHNGYAYAETHFDDEGGEPLYAAPVRTKDLTDDEIMKINVDTASIVPTCDRQFHFARAVIAKFKEKNK